MISSTLEAICWTPCPISSRKPWTCLFNIQQCQGVNANCEWHARWCPTKAVKIDSPYFRKSVVDRKVNLALIFQCDVLFRRWHSGIVTSYCAFNLRLSSCHDSCIEVNLRFEDKNPNVRNVFLVILFRRSWTEWSNKDENTGLVFKVSATLTFGVNWSVSSRVSKNPVLLTTAVRKKYIK